MAESLTSFRMFMASCTGNAKNTTYKYPVEISTPAELAEACKKDHVCTEFAENRRSSANLIKCHAIMGDCDNDNTEDPAAWITPATVAERLPGVAFYAVKSRNCDKVKHPGEPGEKGPRPRWHYYFVLQEAIPNIAIISSIMLRLLVVFPEFDKAGMKPAQFFYGHAEPVAEYHAGNIDIAQYFMKHPEITIAAPAAPVAETEPATPRAAAAGVDETDFIRLNARDMLAAIPADDRKVWTDVGMALKAAGCDVSLFDEWSRKSKTKYKGFNDCLETWNSFNSSGIGPGTLVHYAQEYGWQTDPEKLTGEPKANHEAAEAYKAEMQRYRGEHREEHRAALAAVGIDTEDPYKYEWTLDFDGSIDEVIEKATGEIKYKKPRAAQDPQPGTETVSGIITHQANPDASKPAEKSKHQLTISGYDDVEIKPVDYLFYPWFPRGYITAVQGDSGSSKSTLMYAVGAKVTTGEDMLGVPCEDPGNVMFITIEDDASDIKISFQDAGGDLSKLRRIREREEIARLNLSPAGIKVIDKIIKEENIKLLVLDPIQQFITGDINKASETRPQMAQLMNVAEENHISIVVIEHMGKDTSKSALHRAIGSVDVNASTRALLQVVTDPESDSYKILFTVKNNLAALHDYQRAIRYQVRDHPGSYNHEKQKYERFRGHAEFTEIIQEYNERLYKKATRKADEEAEAEETLQFEYDDDPLVVTAREIASCNPDGLFIGTDDLISKITEVCGRCPYVPTRDKTIGIYQRIHKLRSLMIDKDGIQVDKRDGIIKPKAYHWRGEIFEPDDDRKVHGVYITPIRSGTNGTGSQQTKM